MRTELREFESGAPNPLEVIEQIVAANDWPFDRSREDELAVTIAGTWCEYHMYFSWRDDFRALQMTCAFDFRVNERVRTSVCELLSMINERMWIGHFDLYSEEGYPMFRHTALLRGGWDTGSSQFEDMIEIALNECERFYPAFQFVMWAGKTPQQAVTACMFETAGQA